MLTIDPFGFSPAGPLDPLTAYFYATWMRVSYYGEPSSSRDSLKTLIGADSIEIFDSPTVHPTEVAHLPGGRAIVIIRGTDDNVLLTKLILARGQRQSAGHAGFIHRLISQIAERIWDAIRDTLPDEWTAAGHSLGGAVADLISEFGATRAVSCGAPRVGNSDYANSRNNAIYLRLTNAEDIVPKAPPAAVDVVDHAVLILELFGASPLLGLQTFQHWGTRVNLFADGSITRPPEIGTPREIAEHLSELFLSGTWGLNQHYIPEYLRRLRMQIPVRFPSGADPEFVGLQQLDAINVNLNGLEEVQWIIDPRDSSTLEELRRTMNWRAIANSENVGPPEDPFRCV